MLRIRFQDTEYVLVGESLTEGGPIALEDDYRHGRVSFAHLYADGHISRYGESIGTSDDIEVLGACEIEIDDDAFCNMMSDAGGFPPHAQLTAMVSLLEALKRGLDEA